MSISRQSIEELKRVAKISDFILESTTGKLRGDKGMALCPFHGEKTASMSFTNVENLFHCFGCKEGGDIYKFVQEIRGLDFSEAVEEVANRYSFNLNYDKSSNLVPKKELYKKTNLLTQYFHEELMKSDSGKKGRAFLRSRGLEKESIETFRLGWIGNNEEGFMDYCKAVDVTKKDLQQIGIYNSNAKQFFINRVLFPIFDKRNNVIGFGGRAINSSGPKYLNGPETILYQKSRSLYNAPNFTESAKSEKTIFIFEGYIDVIAASIYGINTGTAPCGTALTNEHLSFLSQFNSTIILCFDNDDAGFEATKRILNLKIRKEKALNIQVVDYENYKDIGEMLENEELDNFKEILDKKQNLVEFILHKEIERKLEQDLRKNEIVYKLSEIINLLSPIEIEEAKSFISEELNIEKQVLEAELNTPKIEMDENEEKIMLSNEFETIFLSEILRKDSQDIDDISNEILSNKDLGLQTRLFDLQQHNKDKSGESFPEYLAKYFTISYEDSEFNEAKNRLYEKILDIKIKELSDKIEISSNKEDTTKLLRDVAEIKKKKESLYNSNN
tara:strand:+ start:10942 stop:12618 length:1677 start_codon:yes stop_codon:yes gene_type:complete